MSPTEYYIHYRNKNRDVIQKINRDFRKRTSVAEFKKICAEKDHEMQPHGDDLHRRISPGAPAFAGHFGIDSEEPVEVPVKIQPPQQAGSEAKPTKNPEDQKGSVAKAGIVHPS